MRVRHPTNYDEDFKAEAVALVHRGDRSKKQVAADLGISYWTLRHWYKSDMERRRARRDRSDARPDSETVEQRVARLERENARLLKENERLRLDREILKKAAAFFAQENE